MKKIMIILMSLLCLPVVFGLYGGESWTYHFDYCDKLRVNITGNLTIDEGEYTIHNDCVNTSKNYFICNCTNDFDFNISFETNTVNDYTLFFNYDYSKEVTEEQTDDNGNGGGGWSSSGGRSKPLIVHMNLEEFVEFISEKGITLKFAKGSSFRFIDTHGQEHIITIRSIFTNKVILIITSDTITMEAYIDKTKQFKNIEITLLSTRYGRATLNFRKLTEKIKEITEETIEDIEDIDLLDEEPPVLEDEEKLVTEKSKSILLPIIIIIFILVSLTVLSIVLIKRKKANEIK